jgi:hypothetical protein
MLKKQIFSGALVGLVNGLFGGGGGMVAVPLFEKTLEYKTLVAHATAILVILPISVVSSIVYIVGGYVDFNILLPTTLGSILGGLIGAKLLGKLPTWVVDWVFILVMTAAGIRMII